MLNLNIELGYCLYPARHDAGRILVHPKPEQTVVVCSENDLRSEQVVTEVLQRLYHSKHLTSSRAVVSLSAVEDCGIERDRLLNSVIY